MPCGILIPRKWRLYKVVWALILLEFPFTVANLALFGIASPNLYRTILWTEGGKRGFNSDPKTVLYAAANYRPVDIPMVWSNFMTQYNLVIGVLCTFFYLIKVTLFLMHVFYPIISVPLHIALTALWAFSLYVQTAPDTIDPARQNKGAPWYISKNCNIVEDKTIRAYCMQAKSAFAVSVLMLVIYAVFLLLSIYSLIPTAAARQAHAARREEKRAEKEKYASSPYDNEMTADEQWQHMWELQQLPRTPGTSGAMKSPMTPRTRAFQSLGGQPIPRETAPPVPMSAYLNQHHYEAPTPQQTYQTTSPYQYQQAASDSPYQNNAEYYGQQELHYPPPGEGGWKGKGAAY